MKTKIVYIEHNEFSNALPSLSGENGLTFSFDLDKLNEELKNKIFGLIGIISLSIDECKEIYASKYRYKDDLSKFSINNIFNNEKVKLKIK